MKSVDFKPPQRPYRHTAGTDLLILSIFGGRRIPGVERELDLRGAKRITTRLRALRAPMPNLTNRFSDLP